MLFLLPPLHFINGAPSHTKSSLVKYDTPPSPSQSVLFFESVNMVALPVVNPQSSRRVSFEQISGSLG